MSCLLLENEVVKLMECFLYYISLLFEGSPIELTFCEFTPTNAMGKCLKLYTYFPSSSGSIWVTTPDENLSDPSVQMKRTFYD